MNPAALTTVLFSHSPMPVDTWLTDVPEAEFRSTQQPTASDGLGEDVEL